MSNKNKRLEKLFQIIEKKRGLNREKKAIQFECNHKTANGKLSLVRASKDNPYLFKCKQCKDKSVDLSILNDGNGSPKEQLKDAFKIFKSAADCVKLQSSNSNKDIKTVELIANALKSNYRMTKFFTKMLKANTAPNPKNKGKQKKVFATVSTNLNNLKY